MPHSRPLKVSSYLAKTVRHLAVCQCADQTYSSLQWLVCSISSALLLQRCFNHLGKLSLARFCYVRRRKTLKHNTDVGGIVWWKKKVARWRRMERAKRFKGQRRDNKNEINAGQKRNYRDTKNWQTAKTLSGAARSYKKKRQWLLIKNIHTSHSSKGRVGWRLISNRLADDQ